MSTPTSSISAGPRLYKGSMVAPPREGEARPRKYPKRGTRKVQFACGDLGHGQFCHKCANAEKAAQKDEKTKKAHPEPLKASGHTLADQLVKTGQVAPPAPKVSKKGLTPKQIKQAEKAAQKATGSTHG